MHRIGQGRHRGSGKYPINVARRKAHKKIGRAIIRLHLIGIERLLWGPRIFEDDRNAPVPKIGGGGYTNIANAVFQIFSRLAARVVKTTDIAPILLPRCVPECVILRIKFSRRDQGLCGDFRPMQAVS